MKAIFVCMTLDGAKAISNMLERFFVSDIIGKQEAMGVAVVTGRDCLGTNKDKEQI